MAKIDLSSVTVKSFRKQVSRQIQKAVADDMRNAGDFLLEETQKRVPRDTGALEQSGKVRPLSKSVRVTFGNKTEVRYGFDRHQQLRTDVARPASPQRGLRGPQYIARAGGDEERKLQENMVKALRKIRTPAGAR